MIFRFALICDQYVSQEIHNRLIAGGCDDATIDANGNLLFSRECPDLTEAIRSAIHDTEHVVPVRCVVVERADVDLLFAK
jgi:hypothetical protein